MDVTGKKRQRKGWLVIMIFRRVAFCFLISLLFFFFGVFVVCKLWSLVCCSSWSVGHPNQKLVVECCFLDFFWLGDEDDLELRTVC
jgi:hypothetical protein